MTRKKLLQLCACGMLVIGLGFIASSLVLSLKPSARARAYLPSYDIADLEAGDSRIVPDIGYTGGGVLILKDYHDTLHVYSLPLIKEGKVAMPDIHWWRPFGALCSAFGPDLDGGKMLHGGVIQCHDNSFSEWGDGAAEWRWSYDGKNLGKYTDDMERLPFKVQGKYLVVGPVP